MRFGSDTYDNALECPHCHTSNLHHEKVEVFDRITDSASTGLHVTVKTKGASCKITNEQETNPSPRRGGIRIEFSCENCPGRSILTIIQHKGSTLLEMEAIRRLRVA